jgi:hypothetical protein
LVLQVGSVLLIRLDSIPALLPPCGGITASRQNHLAHQYQFAVYVELIGRQDLPELRFDIYLQSEPLSPLL